MAGYSDTTPLKIRLLYIAFGLFLIGYFVIPERSPQYLFYYLAVIPLSLSSLRSRPRALPGDRLLLLALVYIFYMVLSLLWSEALTWQCTGFMVARGLLSASFLLTTVFLFRRNPDTFLTLLKVVTLGVALSAIVSALLYYRNYPFPTSRMVSFAQIDNPNTLGAVTGLFALLAVNFALRAPTVTTRLLYTAAASVLVGVVLLTQSRNAVLATGIGILALFTCRHERRQLIVTALLLVLLGGLYFTPLVHRFGETGTPIRLEIWAEALAQIRTAPLFGHGQCTAMHLPTSTLVYTHPHNVYLASAWYGGLPGLLLLLAVLIGALKQALAWRGRYQDALYLALLLYTAAAISVDFGSVITRPREPWLYFWLPLSLAIGAGLRQRFPVTPSKPA